MPRQRIQAEEILKDLGQLGLRSLFSTCGGGDDEEEGRRVVKAAHCKGVEAALIHATEDAAGSTQHNNFLGGRWQGSGKPHIVPFACSLLPPITDDNDTEFLPTTMEINGIAANSPDNDFDDVLSSASHLSLRYMSFTVRQWLMQRLLVLRMDDFVADIVNADVRQLVVRSYLHALAIRWYCWQVAELLPSSLSVLISGGGKSSADREGAAPLPSHPVLGQGIAVTEAGLSPKTVPHCPPPSVATKQAAESFFCQQKNATIIIIESARAFVRLFDP